MLCSPTEAIQKIHQVRAILNGKPSIASACQQVGISVANYYQWCRRYGLPPKGNPPERATLTPPIESR